MARLVQYMTRQAQKVFADKQGFPGNRAPLVLRGLGCPSVSLYAATRKRWAQGMWSRCGSGRGATPLGSIPGCHRSVAQKVEHRAKARQSRVRFPPNAGRKKPAYLEVKRRERSAACGSSNACQQQSPEQRICDTQSQCPETGKAPQSQAIDKRCLHPESTAVVAVALQVNDF